MTVKTLRLKDQNIVENWYIACLSRELNNKPIQRTIYEKAYVLFRSGDKVVCMPDRCLHRHALLSEGEVRSGNLLCPYHGWTYNLNGEVCNIPSEGPECPQQSGLKQITLPCVEQDGAVWVWMGEKSPINPTPPWRFPNFGQKKWISYFMITDFDNEVTNLAENFMDVPHTIFVHRGWFRDETVQPKKNPTTVLTKNARVLVTYHQEKDSFSFVARTLLNPKNEKMKHTDEFIYPNITRVDYCFGDKNAFIINSQCTPVGLMKSRVYTYIAYRVPLLGKIIEPIVRFYTRQVIEQDVLIMKNQSKSLALDPETNFRSTDADEVHKAIERLRYYGMKNDEKLKSFELEKKIDFWM